VTRYVIHLPVTVADLDAAVRLARVVARTMSFLPQVDAQATTVAAEVEHAAAESAEAAGAVTGVEAVADPDVRHRVFCDRRLPSGRPCLLRPGHDGACSRRIGRRSC
jgi:hypothetical protein